MRFSKLMLFIILLFSLPAAAQTSRIVRGWVRDSTGNILPGAGIRLTSAHDTLNTISRDDGSFEIFRVKDTRFRLQVSMMSYNAFVKEYSVSAGDSLVRLDTMFLGTYAHQLKEITIKAEVPDIVMKEDTVEYNVAAYKVKEGAMIRAVVKKLPGIEMDHNGRVTVQGKEVAGVRVNGKDFFGGDLLTALNNLPANIVDKLQVIDDYGEQARMSGVKTGASQKIINIKLKKNGGMFATATGSIGTHDRHMLSANANAFDGDRQMAVMGEINNTGTGAFTFGEPANAVRSGGGTTTMRNLSLNYRDKIGKKMEGYGNLRYSSMNMIMSSLSEQQSFVGNYVNKNNQQNTGTSKNNDVGFDYQLDYNIDKRNTLKISPSFNTGKSISDNNSLFHIEQVNLNPQKISDGTNLNSSTGNNPTIGGNLMFNHRFEKKGRNLNVSARYSYSNRTTVRDIRSLSHIQYVDSTGIDTTLHQSVNDGGGSNRINAGLSYTEPLNKTDVLEFKYEINSNTSNTVRETWNIDPAQAKSRVDSQSNRYNDLFMTQRIGVNYDMRHKVHNLVLGLALQPLLLNGTNSRPAFSTQKKAFNLIPTARYTYNISQFMAIGADYNAMNQQPNFMQLMPITDYSNPQNPVVGNPQLKPELNQTVNIQFRSFDMKSGTTFFMNVSGTQSQHKIVTNMLNDSAHLAHLGNNVIQETRYLNTNGSNTLSAMYSFSKRLLDRKLSLSVNGTCNYGNNVTFVNDLRNFTRNYMWMQAAKVGFELPDVLEEELSGSYATNRTKYSTATNINGNANTVTLEFYGKNYFGEHFIVGYSASKMFNSGFSSGIAANPAIINLYMECQLMKGNKAAIRLQGFDLLNESTGISRSVSDNMITDTRSTVLARYFLLSFSYRFQKFGA